METQFWCLCVPAGCVVGGLIKGTMVPASISVPERAPPPALTMKPVPPHMSLAPLKLLSLCWSLG